MATYERREITTTRVEFRVPAEPPYGAAWVEVMKAIHAAHAELAEAGVIERGQDAPADRIVISPADDAVIVAYKRDDEENDQ